MSAGSRLPQPKFSDWLHSGRYLLIALILHGLVLLYPLTLNVAPHEVTPPKPLQVQMTEHVSPTQAIPPPAPEKPAPQRLPRKEMKDQLPHQVLALAPEQTSAPATFTVPAPVVASPASPPANTPANNASEPAVTSARFDAAYLHNPHPEYPPISRRLGEEGKVLLKVRVTADGRASAVDIEKSSSFERLDDAALRSVTRWRFVPAKRGDEAIESTVIVPVVFRLDN
jgi:periplasmic protein TonB